MGTLLQHKAISELKVTYEDGTTETFVLPPGTGFYRESYTFAQSDNGKVTGVLDEHELYWTVKREETK